MARGNLINYPHKLTTTNADLTTSKFIWNSVLSTEDARFMDIDIKNFYLGPPLALDWYKYTEIPIALSPQHTYTQYNLLQHVTGGYIYLSHDALPISNRRGKDEDGAGR